METGIPYSLETPRGTVYFNGFDQDAVAGYLKPYFRLQDVEGLDGAVLRTPTEERPQRPGLIAFPFLPGGRFPALIGVIVPRTLAERRQMEDTLRGQMASMLNVDGKLRWRPRAAHLRWGLPFTVANLITPASRQANVDGDGGDPAESATGIWEPTTNLITNGGLETNTTGWTGLGIGTAISRQTSSPKFGAGYLQVVTNNSQANEGAYHSFVASGSVIHTLSIWARRNSGTGTVRVALRDNTGTLITAGTTVTLDTNYQRLTLVTGALVNGTTYRLSIETNVQQGITFFADGAQAEAQPLATPYKETNGATASRNQAGLLGISGPLGGPGLVNSAYGIVRPDTGWMSITFRPRWPSSAAPEGAALVYLWSWVDGATGHKLIVYYDPADDKYKFTRQALSPTAVQTAAVTFAAGDIQTVTVRWTPTNLYISANGGASVSGASTQIAELGTASFSIGYNYDGATGWLDGEILSFALGLGTLTDADVAALYGLAGNDSGGLSQLMRGSEFLSDGAMPSLLWNAKDATYLVQQERRVPVRSYEPLQMKGADLLKEFRLGMVTPDPLMLSEALYSAIVTTPSPYLLTIDNTLDGSDGTGLDTLYPVITVQANPGTFNNVDIQNDDTGKLVRLTGLGLSSLQTVTIDMRNETVLRNDGVDLSGKIDFTVSEFWGVAPGQQDVASLRNLSGGGVGSHRADYRLVFAG